MIARLRKKFIIIAVSSVAAVLILIMGIINAANFYNTKKNADETLMYLAENGGIFPGEGSTLGKILGMSPETPYETRYFTVILSSSGVAVTVNTGNIFAVSSEQAIAYAIETANSGAKSGYKGNYRYLVCPGQDSTMVIFLDNTRALANVSSFLWSSVFVSVFGIFAVFILLVIFSKRAIAPIAESYEKQKRFITDAGHEIKTPLTVIDANAEVIELETGESEWTKSIHSEVKRLSKLTGSLIALSRMEENTHPLIVTDFSLSDAVAEAAEPFFALAKSNGHIIAASIEENISYTGDEGALRSLVGILLDNAVKYSTEGGTISISLKKQAKSIYLVCKNPTAPVAPGNHPELFERFYRGDESRSSTGGYGIGLSLAMTTVELHKGKLTAKSDDGCSLTFTAIL